MEPLEIPWLLEKTRDFPPKLRPLMAVFGTLQGALSLLFEEEVTVRLVKQVATGLTMEREVELVAGDRVVARATSRIECTIAQQAYFQDIVAGKMGIGQLLTKHGIKYQTRLISCEYSDDTCRRTYNIWGPGVSITIVESFPEELYLDTSLARMSEENMWAYTAGFFDGEGSVSIWRSKHTGKPIGIRVSIGQKNPGVLYTLQTWLGSQGIQAKVPLRRGRNVPQLTMQDKKNAIAFLKNVIRYSVVKRSQIEQAFFAAAEFKHWGNPNVVCPGCDIGFHVPPSRLRRTKVVFHSRECRLNSLRRRRGGQGQ